jgi:8-oxo-dGTP diphosphatase
VLEETGLRVRATELIGSRVHPVTGVRMTYVATTPEDEAAIVAAGDELVEVRWVAVARPCALMPGMADPAREHLRKILRS